MESALAFAAALRIAHESEADTLADALIRQLEAWPVPSKDNHSWIAALRNRRSRKHLYIARRTCDPALINAWRHLSAPHRRRAMHLLQGRVHQVLAAALRQAAASESIARFIGDSGDPTLLTALLPIISDADPRAASAAEESLVHVSQTLAPCPASHDFPSPSSFEYLEVAPKSISVESLAALRAQLADLCITFPDHRRKGVLAAAVSLLGSASIAFGGDPLGRWFLDEAAGSHPALRSMLRRGTGPLSRARAWEWLTRPALATAVEERLGRADSPDEFAAVLERSHLLENPRRAARLDGLRQRRRIPLLPALDAVAPLSPSARRGVPRMPGVDEPELLALLPDPDDAARLGAAAALPCTSVLDFCFDPSEPIARFAAVRWWLGVGGVSGQERSRVAANLTRSPHPSVRRLGSAFLQHSRRDAAANLDLLRAAIRTTSGEDRLRAIQHARRLGLQRSIELELLSILSAAADSEAVLASAVSALGEAGSNSSAEAVELCLSHALPRIRSNAAESLVKRSLGRGDLAAQSPRLYDSLIEMKSDPSHRVRASAIRAMLRAACPEWGGTGFEPAAADELLKMLEDDRPMHRLAGLWAAEHAGEGESIRRRWDQLASRVAHLAAEDPDDAVQRRAVWCARRLLSRDAGPSIPELSR
ncbi:MAG: HEAT repeat domain-containing protein [Phycisphaeraceae bacterium]|nr:HEAT repeat domain-containing protein [Phycisphaeraceae bacterium]